MNVVYFETIETKTTSKKSNKQQYNNIWRQEKYDSV